MWIQAAAASNGRMEERQKSIGGEGFQIVYFMGHWTKLRTIFKFLGVFVPSKLFKRKPTIVVTGCKCELRRLAEEIDVFN
jgi:hypothetical protein